MGRLVKGKGTVSAGGNAAERCSNRVLYVGCERPSYCELPVGGVFLSDHD
jgi:hypothetical protein